MPLPGAEEKPVGWDALNELAHEVSQFTSEIVLVGLSDRFAVTDELTHVRNFSVPLKECNCRVVKGVRSFEIHSMPGFSLNDF